MGNNDLENRIPANNRQIQEYALELEEMELLDSIAFLLFLNKLKNGELTVEEIQLYLNSFADRIYRLLKSSKYIQINFWFDELQKVLKVLEPEEVDLFFSILLEICKSLASLNQSHSYKHSKALSEYMDVYLWPILENSFRREISDIANNSGRRIQFRHILKGW